MNFLKKGPELKLSELKVPDFFWDIYYDLKERHLLPLVALLAISIVVVPIAISRTASSDSEEEAPVATPSVVGSEASTLTVAKSAPGLRDYRRRLKGARALDPFREASEAAAASEASSGGAAGAPEPVAAPAITESSGAPVEAPIESEAPTESSPPISLPSEPEGLGATTVTQTRTKYATATIDVRIVTASQADGGARASAKPSTEIKRTLPELTMLPSRGAPAAVFMGTSADSKKALLLVSSDVQSIFGDGQCIVGSKTCQLLALEEGVPETFVYGPRAKTYRIEVLKISQVLTDKPHRASLGGKGRKGSNPKRGAGAAEEGAPRVSLAQPR
ncbi:MAG: hypothetical protein AB7V58_14185 [Solirubrobacterales bacterium]